VQTQPVASPTLVIGIDLLLIFLEQMVVCPLIESVAIIRNPQRAGVIVPRA
jgi:ABC-type sulfate transport system permease component